MRVMYRKGIPLGGSDVDYDLLSLTVYDRYLKLGLLGHSAFSLTGGGFLNDRSLYYMDAQHFSGNSDVYAGLSFDRFYLLGNYQAYSTDYFLRSEEHTSELQSLMRISYSVFCLKKKQHYTSYDTSS